MNRKFIYVEVRQISDDEAPSFRHCVVQAEDEEDAYLKGARLCDATPKPHHSSGGLLNDYVIAL